MAEVSSNVESGASTTNSSSNSSNNHKYDRQLRIWGSQGQYYVSNTCIVVIHVTAVATETIKNCILPGIQHIHIIDISSMISDDPNTNSEYASNFFLTQTTSHNNNTTSTNTTTTTTTTRAAMALQYLLELNPDVSGTHETYDDISMTTTSNGFAATNNDSNSNNDNIFQKKLRYLQSMYQNVIVLGCDLDVTMIQNITHSIISLFTTTTTSTTSNNTSTSSENPMSRTTNHHIPFLTVHSYGMMGILQIQYLPMHPMMNPNGNSSHQNTATTSRTVPDLRLLHSFPLLQNYMESFIETHFTTTTTTGSSISTVPLLLSTHEYGNIPYPILLYYAYHYLWKHPYPNNNIRPITTVEQKKEFQLLIQNHYYEMTTTTTNRTTSTTTIHPNELPINVQEAIQNSYLAYTTPKVDIEHLQSLLNRLSIYHQQNHPNVHNVEGMKFFLVLQAIYQFMTTTTTTDTLSSSLLQPPVHGTIPDMTASTNAYIELQSIYKEQSMIDLARLRTLITIASHQVEWITSHDKNQKNIIDWNTLIDDEYIRTFCFNIHNVNVISCCRMPNTEHHNMMSSSNNTDDDIGTEITMMLDDYTENDINEDVQIPFVWYICYEACQLFHQQEHRYPGAFRIDNDETELLWQDAKQLQSYIVQILQNDPKYTGLDTHPVIQRTLLQSYSSTMNDDSNGTSIPMTVEDDTNNDTTSTNHRPSKYAIEMVRYGNGEIHTIASIMGGITAQEMIKIITYQYVPMNNTYVYNGITSTGSVYTL